ncbi:MAG: MOSC domain-containing protein [Bacteroidia bacterium]|nr:MOSC domain-containing protein [Bacteroidia bacterium]
MMSFYECIIAQADVKVRSTNIAQAKEVVWKSKKIQTGIYKYPTESGIYLGAEDVVKDSVVDRKYHGGVDKACYAFSADVYPEWKTMYPNLEWDFGMFGENLTIDGLDERQIYIGDQYQIGEALVEVSEPREPCFKLGIRFGTQAVLKSFINQSHCGVYFRTIREGKVHIGDDVQLVKRVQEEFSMARIYWLRYNAQLKHIPEIHSALNIESLAVSAKDGLRKRLTYLDQPGSL